MEDFTTFFKTMEVLNNILTNGRLIGHTCLLNLEMGENSVGDENEISDIYNTNKECLKNVRIIFF